MIRQNGVALLAAMAMLSASCHVALAQGKTGASGGDSSGLSRRVQSLEEQLVDMQVVVGTLESLGKSGGASAAYAGAGASAADAGRIDALERQIQSMNAEIQRLTTQVRDLGGTPQPGRSGSNTWSPPGAIPTTTQVGAATPAPRDLTPQGGSGDPIGGLIAATPAPAAAAGSAWDTSVGTSSGALAPQFESGSANPKELYETAYGYLLQRDYGAAQAAFEDFLKKYPSDSLAGNAQYWLGETYFVRGQYKSAANAFLKGYQSYGQGAKAPDSLLKLAMSLDRLGQKDAACTSYSELNTRFPNAPESLKTRAQSERRRVGCT